MKLAIRREQCVGNARCHAVAPHMFPLDPVGYIEIDGLDVPAGEEALARRGARACPERIIEVIDDGDGQD